MLEGKKSSKLKIRTMTLTVEELRIKRILDVYGDGIFRFACSYLYNEADAQEIVQDTILQLLRYNPTFESNEKEKAWLFKTATNLSRNKLRSRNAYQEDPIDERIAAQEKEDLSFVWEAVKQLPENDREVVHLYYQEGYSTKEIATILNRKEGTVRSDLSRARVKLKELLKEAYDFE